MVVRRNIRIMELFGIGYVHDELMGGSVKNIFFRTRLSRFALPHIQRTPAVNMFQNANETQTVKLIKMCKCLSRVCM